MHHKLQLIIFFKLKTTGHMSLNLTTVQNALHVTLNMRLNLFWLLLPLQYYYYFHLTALFSRTTWVIRHQKAESFWILIKQDSHQWIQMVDEFNDSNKKLSSAVSAVSVFKTFTRCSRKTDTLVYFDNNFDKYELIIPPPTVVAGGIIFYCWSFFLFLFFLLPQDLRVDREPF